MPVPSPSTPRLDLIDLDHLTLDHGNHNAPWCDHDENDEDCPDQPPDDWTPTGDFDACVMEVTAFIAGEPWSDSPECVSPVIAAFLRTWNDSLPDSDRQQLKRWAVPVIGTNTGPADDDTRAWIACDWLVRTHTPAWLRLAGLTDQADLLAGVPGLRPDTVPTIRPPLEAARTDARAAWAAAGAAAGAAARAAAWDAAGAAARDAARAAAWAAAGAAAWDAAGDAARAAAGDAARAAAGDAARAAAGAAARAAAWDAAGDAARAAARERLRPTVTELQSSAHGLIAAMCEVGRRAGPSDR